MDEQSPFLIRTVQRIDRFTDAIGSMVALLCIPLMVVVVWEVYSRYFMDQPTVWAFETAFMLYGTIFMLGAAYALHKGAHIRTDFFFEKWSIRTKGVIDSIAYVIFFFPSLVVFMFVGANEAWYSYTITEESEQTPWRPLLWPFKTVVPLASLLLLIQGVSETIKSIYAARTGIELEHKEKTEI